MCNYFEANTGVSQAISPEMLLPGGHMARTVFHMQPFTSVLLPSQPPSLSLSRLTSRPFIRYSVFPALIISSALLYPILFYSRTQWHSQRYIVQKHLTPFPHPPYPPLHLAPQTYLRPNPSLNGWRGIRFANIDPPSPPVSLPRLEYPGPARLQTSLEPLRSHMMGGEGWC